MGSIIGFFLAGILAAGAGAGYALKIAPQLAAPPGAAEGGHGTAAEKPKEGAPGAGIFELKPIVASLTFPADVWVRLEASVVVDPMPPKESELLLATVTEDVHAFLRTLSLPQLQGAAGLENLREDLQDRLLVRSKGHVHEVFIRGLVLQ